MRLLDTTDQLGRVQLIDAGPPLGAPAFDVIVWACTRWRELRGSAGDLLGDQPRWARRRR